MRALGRLRARIADTEGSPLDHALAAWIRFLARDLTEASAAELAATRAMTEVLEVIKPTGIWATRWFEDGIDEGQVKILRRQVARRFGADTVRELFASWDHLSDPDRIDAIADALIDSHTAEDFLAQVGSGAPQPGE